MPAVGTQVTRTLWGVGAGCEAVLADGRVVRVVARDPGGDVYIHGAGGLEWLGGELELKPSVKRLEDQASDEQRDSSDPDGPSVGSSDAE